MAMLSPEELLSRWGDGPGGSAGRHMPESFHRKLGQVATRLEMKPDDLLNIINFETGGTFNPAERNKAGSSGTGLIQFMDKTARGMGTTTQKLAQMSAEDQLDYVEKYFQPYKGKLGNTKDAYMAVLYPAAIGKPEEHTLFQQGTKAYTQNKGLDKDNKGRVTVGDALGFVLRKAGQLVSPRSAEAAEPVRSQPTGGGQPVASPQTQTGGRVLSLEDLESRLGLAPPAPPTSSPEEAQQTIERFRMGDKAPAAVAIQEASWEQQMAERPWYQKIWGTPSDPKAPDKVPPSQTFAPGYTEPGLEEQNPAREWAATGIEGLSTVAGATLGTATSPVTGFAGPMMGAALGGSYGRRLTNKLGLRDQEEPLYTVPKDVIPGTGNPSFNVYPSDVANMITSVIMGAPDILRATTGGKRILQAQADTEAARLEWETAKKTAQGADDAKLSWRHEQYEKKLKAREEIIKQNREDFDKAVTKYDTDVEAARAQQQQQGRADIQQGQTAFRGEVAQQQADITSQAQAVQTAQGLPKSKAYAPETPSWKLYDDFGAAAKGEPLDLTGPKTTLTELKASRVGAGGEPIPLPSQVQGFADRLEKAAQTMDMVQVRNEMKALGELTRSPNGNIRGPAKQIYGAYAEALEQSPHANELLQKANTAWRQEQALLDVKDWVKTREGGIVQVDSQGRKKINVGRLLSKLEEEIGDGTTPFAKSLGPEKAQKLKDDLYKLAGTPDMPSSPVPAPRPELLPGGISDAAANKGLPKKPTLEADPHLPNPPGAGPPGSTKMEKGLAAKPRPEDIQPDKNIPFPKPFTRGQGFTATGLGTAYLAAKQAGIPDAAINKVAMATGVLKGAQYSGQVGDWLLSKAMLSDKLRPMVTEFIKGGTIDPRVYPLIVAGLTAAERKQMERETKQKARR